MHQPSAIELVAFQLAIALSLFVIVNVLGRNSPMFGYESISMFSDPDDSLAFNFMFRVVTPVVLVIIVAAGCYYLDEDRYTRDLYLAIPYSIAFRLMFNIVRGRAFLLPWKRLLVQWAATLLLGWLAYKHLITRREYLLPDLKTVGNEVWLAIGGYLYVLSGHVFSGDSGIAARSARYARHRYRIFERRYGSVVRDSTRSKAWEPLVYAVLIVEDFNRPAIYRALERIAFRFGKPRSLGIMQVQTSSPMTDDESIRHGTDLLKKYYAEISAMDSWRLGPEYRTNWNPDDVPRYEESQLIHSVLVRYNPSGDYAREIEEVCKVLREDFYPPALRTLHPDFLSGPAAAESA